MKQASTLFLLGIFMLHFQNVNGQWAEAPGLITSSFHNTGVAWEGKVYFTGGPLTQYVTTTNYSKNFEVLDLETGEVTPGPVNLSPSRCAIGGVAYAGKIYFAGGHRWTSASPGLQLYNELDIFDVATQTWEYQHLPTAKTWFATAIVKGKIMFAGGYVKIGSQILPTAVVDIYDPSDGTWSIMHLSQPRAELSAGVIGNKVWFCGGQQSWTAWQASSRVDAYDADLIEWTEAELSVARSYAAVATAGKYLICAGGYTNTQGSSNKVDILDSSNDNWGTKNLSAPRFGIATATLGTKAYFTGGGHLDLSASYYDASSNKVDIFDAADSTWSTKTLNKNRMTHSCAAWGNKLAVGGGWRAEQTQTTGSVEILTDTSIVLATNNTAEDKGFTIFPNPVTTQLTIQLTTDTQPSSDASVNIYDLVGRTFIHKKLQGKSTVLDVEKLEPGVYLLEVRSGQGRWVEKVVVSKI